MNFGVGVEARDFVFENQVRPHAPGGEIPHALLVFGSVRVAIEVTHAFPLRILEQLYEEERALHVFATEAKILIESARLLSVQIDVKELACLERLRHAVREIESGHRVVRDFGIQSNHVGSVERVDERQHVPDCRQKDVSARLVRFWLERELERVSL